MLKETGLSEDFTIHSLRHSFASHALMNNVPPIQVSHFLGHADANITLSTYGHFIPSVNTKVADAIEGVIPN